MALCLSYKKVKGKVRPITGHEGPEGGIDIYEGHLESKERFAIQRYLLILGKKKICRFYDTPSPTSPHSHLGH